MPFAYSPRVLKISVTFCTIARRDRNHCCCCCCCRLFDPSLSRLHVVCHKTGTHERNIVEADYHSSSKRESIIKYHTVLFHVPKNCVPVIYDTVIYVYMRIRLTYIMWDDPEGLRPQISPPERITVRKFQFFLFFFNE